MISRLIAHLTLLRDSLPQFDRAWLARTIEAAAELWKSPGRHGHADDYEAVLAELENLAGGGEPPAAVLKDGSVQVPGFSGNNAALEPVLAKLKPWRKGPWNFGGVTVDTEWRSDWKWNRLAPHIFRLDGRRVLDVGCGSGYHLWRAALAGASVCLGLEPFLLSCSQFMATVAGIPKAVENAAVPAVIPITLEEVPKSAWFDTVFSMGLLSHQRSPFDHLAGLAQMLRPGGELVLENLVVTDRQLLVPTDRYAKMRNVWFIPSPAELETWLARAGFVNIRTVDVAKTEPGEQRRTPWMEFESLENFLDRADSARTIEGHPAPQRAILLASKPA